jgi:hypothetical protein
MAAAQVYLMLLSPLELKKNGQIEPEEAQMFWTEM